MARAEGVPAALAALAGAGRSVAAPGGGLYVTVRLSVTVLFAASRAVTVITVVPEATGTEATDHDVVPVAVPLPPRLVLQVTCVTPTLSEAVPLSAIVAGPFPLARALLSGEAFTVHLACWTPDR